MRKYIYIATMFLSPAVAFAAFEKTNDLIKAVGGIVNQLIIIAGGLALLVFLWGLVKFIFKANDPESNKEGKNLMKWGIIALFVMVSVWGIVGFIQRGFGLPATTTGSTSTTNLNTGSSGNPCFDAFENPTYIGDCGTY